MSLRVMDDWAEYLFQTARTMLGEVIEGDIESAESFGDIKAFCVGRVHNIWGSDRNEDNPEVILHYDIAGWMRSPLSTPLSECKFSRPVEYRFSFPEAKKEEMAAQSLRYDTTATGIGREAEASSEPSRMPGLGANGAPPQVQAVQSSVTV